MTVQTFDDDGRLIIVNNAKALSGVTTELVEIYAEALKSMRGSYCKECERTGAPNASILREIREFLKQHSIALDPKSAPLQDLSDDLPDVIKFPVKK